MAWSASQTCPTDGVVIHSCLRRGARPRGYNDIPKLSSWIFSSSESMSLASKIFRKFGTGVDCYMLIMILIFIFSKFFSVIFFGQILSQNLKFSKLTEIWYRGTLLCTY